MSTAKTALVTTYKNDADISKFNRGAITTSFTPPASCFVTPTLAGNGDWYLGHYRNSYYDPSCMPSSTSNSLSWDMYYYSPAVSCPYNFYTASTVRNSFTGFQTTAVLSIESDTSVYVCCPTGYTVQNYHHVCTSKFSGTTVIEFYSPILDQAGTWTRTAAVSTTTTAFPDSTPMIFYADGIPIWFQSSDKAVTTTSSTSSSATSTSSNTSSSALVSPTTSVATATGPPLPTVSPKDTLSTGAKAGIGAGVGVLVLGIALILGFLFLKRRKRRPGQAPGSRPTGENEPKELHDTGLRPELHSTDIKELPTSGRHESHREATELAA